jgi:putative solute:sodium symporter small subunit
MVVGFMTVGFSVSFVLPFFARSLSAVRFFGWNLAYYMAAQGAILVYLLLVLAYALAMRKLDRRLEGEAGPSS